MFLSGETFNKICHVSIYQRDNDFNYILFNQLNNIIYVNENNVLDDIISKKNIIFLKIDYIDFFTKSILPKLKEKFILVTHNGDIMSGKNNIIIEHPLLIKWFGQNMTIDSKKTEGIPIGLENSIWRRTNFEIITKNYNNSKDNLLYLNFSINTNKERIQIMKTLLSKGFIQNKKLPWNKYMSELSSYKFALSPEGNGIDCHRTWECLYLGVIPIVKKSVAMSFFSDLPILFVDNYDNITKKFLLEVYENKFKNKKFNLNKLNTMYYLKKFNKLLSR